MQEYDDMVHEDYIEYVVNSSADWLDSERIYTFMHKETPIAELSIDAESATIMKVLEIANLEHLPIGIRVNNGKPAITSLNNWWKSRAIPQSRPGLREALEELEVDHSAFMILKCYGLSLSDTYWMKPRSKTLKWKDVNFYDNDFSEDVGKALFGKVIDTDNPNLQSPDNTTDGVYKKRWIIGSNGERILSKGGRPILYQEPLNEVIASEIMQRLGILHAHYTLAFDEEDKPLSQCECFVNGNEDIVSAYNIDKKLKRRGSDSYYNHYVNCCKEYGIDVVDELNRMIVIDFIMANTDRHWTNFACLRDSDTLKFTKPTPIYDTGASFWHESPDRDIHSLSDYKTMTFNKSGSSQIKLITDLSWYDPEVLKGIDDYANEIFKQAYTISAERRDRLINALKARISLMNHIVCGTAKYNPIQKIWGY
jgi:hypothetical protein